MTEPPSPVPAATVLYEGDLSPEWERTDAAFIGDGNVVDLFIRLYAPPPSIRVELPVFFDWRMLVNPTGESGDWYAETMEESVTDPAECTVNYRPVVRRILGLEGLVMHAAQGGFEEGEFAMSSHHVRLGMNARQLRMVFRGQLGGAGAQIKITLLRGR